MAYNPLGDYKPRKLNTSDHSYSLTDVTYSVTDMQDKYREKVLPRDPIQESYRKDNRTIYVGITPYFGEDTLARAAKPKPEVRNRIPVV